MGSGTTFTKSYYMSQIESKTRLLAKYQQDLAHWKALLTHTPTKDATKRDIERCKGEIARVKGEISVLKMKMKNAPKG